MRVVLSTCAENPALGRSDALLAAELEQRGHTVVALPWNEAAVSSYADVDVVVLRANWDYHEAPEIFVAWLNRLEESGVRVLNEPKLVRWNFDKRYLLELQEKLAGQAVAATEAGGQLRLPEVHVVDPRDPESIVALMAQLGWQEGVLKSLSGQSGYHCERIRQDTPQVWEAAARAIPTEKALLQAFQPAISTLSETVFVFFGGEFSHAAKRVIADGEWRANSRFGAVVEGVAAPSPLVVEQARRVLQAATPTGTPAPLYARVDGIVDSETFTLMELELIEPALYMQTNAGAAGRFADALESAMVAEVAGGGAQQQPPAKKSRTTRGRR